MKEISTQHLINIFEVFEWALMDTVQELDHIQDRNEITSDNFMIALARNVENRHNDAKTLGVDWKVVLEIVSALHDTISSTQDPSPKVFSNLRLVWSRQDD